MNRPGWWPRRRPPSVSHSSFSEATEALLPPVSLTLTVEHELISLTATTYDQPGPGRGYGVNVRRTFARRHLGQLVEEVSEFVWHEAPGHPPLWSPERADELLASIGWVRTSRWARPFPAEYSPLGPYWEAPIRRGTRKDR